MRREHSGSGPRRFLPAAAALYNRDAPFALPMKLAGYAQADHAAADYYDISAHRGLGSVGERSG
jgi:hypothetical protein